MRKLIPRMATFLIGLFLFPLFSAQECEKIVSGCNECIRTRDCVWCSNPNLTLTGSKTQYSRCQKKDAHAKDLLCSEDFLEVPKFEKKIEKDAGFSKTVHIRPQAMTIRPIVNVPITINVTYQEEKDKKLDLYYLLDVSKTMENNKRQVIQQSQALQDGLKKITSDLQMGFGSFIDKPVVPFSDSHQISRPKINRPYAFKHNLNLTNDLDQFKKSLDDIQTTENQDIPEGVLDALMQAIVCKDIIGWRNGSRRLIVVATDDLFHIAGDGKLGGVVVPNDMNCHIDKDGYYDKATEFDYPSIGQINHVVQQHGAYVIFTIVQKGSSSRDVQEHYDELKKQVRFSEVAPLRADSSDVVETIRKLYKSISSKVELVQKNFERPEDGLKVDFQVQCKSGEGFKDGNSCDDVKPEEVINFRIKLTLTKCPELNEPHKNEVIFSTFDLIGKGEQLGVNLDFSNCECQCNKDYKTVKYEAEANRLCSGSTNAAGMKCGLCDCHEGFSGINCECSREAGSAYAKEKCMKPGELKVCSDRGDCECGSCKCKTDQNYSGQYCECDDSPCIDIMENRRILCAGNGMCDCGQNGTSSRCICKDGFGGSRCECKDSKKNHCKNPGDPNGPDCSGQGKCTCSNVGQPGWRCECGGKYSGPFCEIQPEGTSPTQSKQCEDPRLHECLRETLKQTEAEMTRKRQSNLPDCSGAIEQDDLKKTENCFMPKSIKDLSKNKCEYAVEVGDGINSFDVKVAASLNEKWSCEEMYNDTCKMKFDFSYQSGEKRRELKVRVLEVSKSLCVESLPVIIYILAIAGSILAIGILTLLLWKLFTMWHDRVEFQKFENERAAARWDMGENPLYNTPTSQFENPAYRR